MKNAHKLSLWYHGIYGSKDENIIVTPFAVPLDPSKKLQNIHKEYERLKAKLLEKKERLEESQELATLREAEQQEYSKLIDEMKATQKAQKALLEAQEATFENEKKSFEAKIMELSCSISSDERQKLSQIYGKRGDEIPCTISLDEEETFQIIDWKLNEAGWEADSDGLDYQQGIRPKLGKNRAISHWECVDTKGQVSHVDYALFIGLKPVALIKVTHALEGTEQGIGIAERLSRDINLRVLEDVAREENYELILDAWYSDAKEQEHYRVPMVYASNGREYHPERKEQSGIWFRDLRRLENKSCQILQWFSPEEIAEFLDRNDENLVG